MSGTAPQAVVERALELARADECMVLVEETSSANLRWAGNSLTTNGATRGRTVTVVALNRTSRGVAVGTRSRTGVRDDELEDLVRAAEAAGEEALPTDDASPLLTPEDACAPAKATPWDAPAAATDMSAFSGVAPGLGRAFERAGAGGRRLYGYAEHTVTSTFLGTSTGVRLRHDQPTGTIDVNAKSAGEAESGPGTGHSAWVGQATRDFSDVDVDALEHELGRRIGWAERRVDLAAGRYETILPPSAVADMMAFLYLNANGRDAAEGRTVFSAPDGGTRVGDRLATLPLTLFSDPHLPGLECSPFVSATAPGRRVTAFDNGLPLRRTEWISSGELAALTQTRRTAETTGLPLTAFIGNLVLWQADGAATVDEMVAQTERGLLLTCLWYMRTVDPQSLLLTGLTRDGVYLVENGRVTGAVNNFRFNESPVSLLERAVQAGATVPALGREFGDGFTRTAMPPLRVPDFNMSTVSQAS
ncbi:TldD/PmbA family protein [Streptomonospora sp. S1-112]|uniref:TldD/PmbA family protein n=1 Tax=Streptomonospora mangrovi TaxID=2883123 RepID=A0A9X3SGT4_9ACTN|nr:metallopeptidase TldD-related protein [Streptomonospora mangrovi]MDA0564509.1 TldD/PmbA family protein [Streptomonospora mangrovi]